MMEKKQLIELSEALRMVQNSKDDCPETSIKGCAIWVTAHNCALSCLTSCPTVDAVEVPCKMGNSVWGIKIYNHGREVKQGVVHQMFFGDDMRLCICVKNVCRGKWGKNVFATKEEAEAALAKMDGGNEDG